MNSTFITSTFVLISRDEEEEEERLLCLFLFSLIIGKLTALSDDLSGTYRDADFVISVEIRFSLWSKLPLFIRTFAEESSLRGTRKLSFCFFKIFYGK